MNFLQNVPNCCCRRRIIVGRLLPVLLQIILVVIIWKIIKSHSSPRNDITDVSKRDVPGAASQDQSRCLFAEFSQAQLMHVLNVTSLLSTSKFPQQDSEENQTPHLLVDVYVRDRQKGTVTFFPVGTQVNIQRDKNAKEDKKNEADNSDYRRNYPDYDTGVGNIVPSVKDKTSNSVKQSPTQLLLNKGGLPQVVKDAVGQSGFQFGLGNMQNQYSNSADQQGNANSAFGQNQMSRIGFGGQLEQESGQGGVRNADIIKYQNSIGEVNQFPGQQPYQKIGQLVNRKNFNEQVVANDEQRNQGFEFGAQGQNSLDRNLVHTGGNELHYQNINKPLNSQLQRNPDYHSQQNNELQSDVQQWGVAGSNIQQNVPSHVQQWEAPGSAGFQRQKPNAEVAVSGDSEPLLKEGYLDRAKKFISELRGKLADTGIPETGKQTILLQVNSPQVCQGEIDLVYLVNSKPQSSDLRQRIRDTFAKTSYFQPSVVAHVFLLGKTSSPNFQQRLNQEQQQYGDIVQGDFADVPENATYKGLMGMQWVTQFCPHAKFIMIINEDVFVDTDKLIHGFIPATKKVASERVMYCFFNPESPIPRSGPNAVSEQFFPGRTNLRPYCKGFAILTTTNVVSSLLAASEHVPLVPLDELYLYGILPFIAGEIDVFDVGNKRAFNNFGMETVVCYQQLQDKCPFVASVAFSERFTTLWQIAKNRMEKMQQTHQGPTERQSLWNIPSYIRKF
ncbi:unnamed protein product [Candidula unifasciata]|uniref:Hexosyltransferase n=1 Tax=Candidula unifasciata TaxID=100452 RepID=A0A8S4A470_9EUPU|nr:unnamed protein product [Candidula unifasciata]